MSKRARSDAGASVCADPIGALLSTVELARTKLEAMLTNQVDEIAGLKAQLTETAEACGTHVEATNASLVQREEELRAEVRRMQEHAGQMEEVITLNVGGSKFTTSRTTLTGRPSFLATMFSGRHALQASGDGSYFIDRDPTHFRRILNYLRTGAIAVPEDEQEKAELLCEVDFYALMDLATELRAPTLRIDLGEEITLERAREAELRAHFASGRGRAMPAHAGLINIFNDEGVIDSLVHAPGAAIFPTLLALDVTEAAPPARVAVATLERFRHNFSVRNPNILQRLESLLAAEPIFIAGGAVLHALTVDEQTRFGATLWHRHELQARKSDIDIFVHAASAPEASHICHAIYTALAVDQEVWLVTRGSGVVNITHVDVDNNADNLTVQVVLRLYDSPSEVLHGFDVDCACVGFDGTAVWALPRCVRALRTGVNVLNPLHAWPNRPTYEFRLVKYASRGFAVAVPSLDLTNVDLLAFNRTPLEELKGLARLLKLTLACQAKLQQGVRLEKLDALAYATLASRRAHAVQDPLSVPALDRGLFLSIDDMMAKAISEGRYDDHFDLIMPWVFGFTVSEELPDNGPPLDEISKERLTGKWSEAFHTARDTRDLAWVQIADAGDAWTSDRVARRIDDAWDASKRSREYLNAVELNLEARYYVHAANAHAQQAT